MKAHVRAGRLEHQRRYVVPLGQGLFHQVDVVRRKDDHGLERLRGDAAEARSSGQRVVAPAVEMVVELDHLGLARIGARQPQGHHDGLGARALEADLLGARHELAHQFAPADLGIG